MYILHKKTPVRIVCNVDYQHPSNVLFIELHVLKLHDLIELRTAMIMYKANTGCLPVNLQTMFRMNSEKIHNTRNSSNVKPAFHGACFGAVSAPILYARVPRRASAAFEKERFHYEHCSCFHRRRLPR